MVTRVVKLNEFASVLDDFSKQHIDDLKGATVRGIVNHLPKIVEDSPHDTGLYAASWDMTFDEKSVIFGNTAPHAPIIEEGARPFRPPLGPLLAWAKRVLKDPSQPPSYSPNVWALAVGTQKKIEAEGMVPRHILQKNIPKIIESIKQEMRLL